RELLAKGAAIYAESIKVVIIKSGSGKLSFFEDGEEFIVYHLQKDNISIIDDVCVLEILEDSEIYSIDADDMGELLKNERFAKAYADTLVNISLLQRQIIKSILFESAKGRIANFLVELAAEQNLTQNGYHYVFLPFSLKVLSSFVGLKRQSASTAFNELIKDDIIRRITPHEFLIVDYEKLQSYTN
ncbi:Crp/Fnr family transcriptional regulator, partial [uncultured Campylobacter sp.]|uniref:Crp/Fnr family transcriptional regulator n=1 Tax=uncultured Campylobacter sp. TaxID=218934 RepID=UPI002609726E